MAGPFAVADRRKRGNGEAPPRPAQKDKRVEDAGEHRVRREAECMGESLPLRSDSDTLAEGAQWHNGSLQAAHPTSSRTGPRLLGAPEREEPRMLVPSHQSEMGEGILSCGRSSRDGESVVVWPHLVTLGFVPVRGWRPFGWTGKGGADVTSNQPCPTLK
jgi:hypothetical protein